MRARIEKEIRRLEDRQRLAVLYAVESGSRAWGFASADSDWDVRFLYVRPLDWYLSVEPGRDVVEEPVRDGLDLSGWDLRKALALHRRGNAALAEWLHSPIVYRDAGGLADRLRATLPRCFRPRTYGHHYLGMAKKTFRRHLRARRVRTKKYFYVLRPLLALAWIERTHAMPPVPFRALVEAGVREPRLLEIIEELLARKIAGDEFGESPRIPELDAFIERRLADLEASLRLMPVRPPPDAAELDAIFRAAVATART